MLSTKLLLTLLLSDYFSERSVSSNEASRESGAVFNGVSGWCTDGKNYCNGLNCRVYRRDGGSCFCDSVSFSHPVHGAGYFECWDKGEEIPEDGTILKVVVDGWGESNTFEWKYPNVKGVIVLPY